MPRSRELNEQMKAERREQILATASKLFAEKGLAATKITDIAAAAEISQGLLYHYYKSKEEIFVELIRGAFERMSAAATGLETLPMPAAGKIKFAIEKLLEGLAHDETFARNFLLIAQASISDAIPEEAKAIVLQNKTNYEVVERIMLEGQRDGTVKDFDAKQLALVFWTTINGLALYKGVHGAKYQPPNPGILISMFLNDK